MDSILNTTPPSSPAAGDEWTDVHGRRFVWTLNSNGSGQWVQVPTHRAVPTPSAAPPITNNAPKCTSAPHPPLSPTPNDLWFDTTTGFFFIWYNDGNTYQWVVTNPGRGSDVTPPSSVAAVNITSAPGIVLTPNPITGNGSIGADPAWLSSHYLPITGGTLTGDLLVDSPAGAQVHLGNAWIDLMATTGGPGVDWQTLSAPVDQKYWQMYPDSGSGNALLLGAASDGWTNLQTWIFNRDGTTSFPNKVGIGTAAPLTLLDVHANVDGTASMGWFVNDSTGASSRSTIVQEAGGRSVFRNVDRSGQYLYEVGSNVPNRYSDFDNHYFRNTAGVAQLTIVPTGATFSTVPVVGTMVSTDNSTKAASTAFVKAQGTIPTALPPNGPAGGDLAGTYPNPTIKPSVTNGQVLTTVGGVAAWAAASGGSSVAVGVTPPGSPTDGSMWFYSDAVNGGGTLYIRYNDGNTTQWVPVAPAAGASGAAGGDLQGTYPNPTIKASVLAPYLLLAGGTMTGQLNGTLSSWTTSVAVTAYAGSGPAFQVAGSVAAGAVDAFLMSIANPSGNTGNIFRLRAGAAGTTDQFKVDMTGDGAFSGSLQAFALSAPPAGGNAAFGYFLGNFTGGNIGLYFGTGAPTLSTSGKFGSIYMNAATPGLPYYNSNGTTGWDRLVGETATQTLTNKTFAPASISPSGTNGFVLTTVAGVSAWAAASGTSVTVGTTPPGSPTDGSMWFYTDAVNGGGTLYVRYNDGNTTQWVPASPAAPPSGPAGGDLTGTYPNPTLVGGPLSNYLTTASATATYQPKDAGLTVLASLGTGIVANTAADTFTPRTITGTASRLAVTNGTGVAGNPTLDIDAAYVGQASITTLGTIATGVWNASLVVGQYGGTGVNNAGKTITLGGNLTTSGAFASTFTMSGITAVTFPTSGTLATTAQIPAALPPNGAASGDLAGTYPSPTIKASVSLTGTPLAPTVATADNTTSIATTAFVKAQAYATLASPTLTGTPIAPTVSPASDSTTKIATTAFVQSAVSAAVPAAQTGHVQATTSGGGFTPSTGADVVIVFATVGSGNTGTWLNTTTGKYTPAAGRYFIQCTNGVQAPSGGNGTWTLTARKNGTRIPGGGTASGSASFSISLTTGFYVDANGTDFFEFVANCASAGMAAQGGAFTAFPI